MSAWPGKYVIGLTGNIATGKSVVRKMLEHLGAYGIDADALSHRAIDKGAPGYQEIIDTFGLWVLSDDGQIDRQKLGQLVFENPGAMEKLEQIVHPIVRMAIDVLARRAEQQVIVIEAIKLLEGKLAEACDTIWVTNAPQKTQLERLMTKRGLNAADARKRISFQGSQEAKMNQAHVVIENSGSYENTWRQVVAAWRTLVPVMETPAPRPRRGRAGEITVHRARPQEAEEIARFIRKITNGKRKPTRADVMAAFGEQAYMILTRDQKMVGLLGWQVENLVTRVKDIILAPKIPLGQAMDLFMREIEKASKQLQSEACLLFLPPELARRVKIWQSLGYVRRSVKDLGVRAWQDAAIESMTPGSILMFKQLRKDRVLRPV